MTKDWTNVSISSWKYFNSKDELLKNIKTHHEIFDESTDPYGTFSMILLNKKSGNYTMFIINKRHDIDKFFSNAHKKYVF